MTGPTGERIAVVGAGVGGLTAAYVLSRAHRVTLWEAQPRLGGHAHTHELDGASGPLRVDTGFIVHNDRTYPLLRRLFGELGIRAHPTEMSMSVRDERSGLEYAGGRGLSGFLARPRQLARGDYRRMLLAVRRFHRLARDFLTTTDDSEPTSFGEFCAAARFGPDFIRLYAVPVVACVWSTGSAEALDYPARHVFRFLDHHVMLELGNSPQWFTVAGGSHRYVEAVASRVAEVRVGRLRDRLPRRRAAHPQEALMSRTLHRTVTTTTPADRVFAYLADFRNAVEWDSGTVSCTRLSGEGGPGSVYRNVSRFAGREVSLDYTVLTRSAPVLVFEGRNATVLGRDTITITEHGEGARVDYLAEFTFSGVARWLGPLVQPLLERLGDQTAAQLTRALDAL